MYARISALAATAAFCSAASAGLIVGYSDAGQTTTVFDIDVETGDATPILDGLSVQGLAVDQASGTLYISSPSAAGPVSDLYSVSLTTRGATPNLIGTLPESMDGLTFANGMLYGTNTTNQFAEGFYQIDPSDASGSLLLQLGATSWSVQSVAYDDASGLFYGSDFDGGNGRGLFSIDLFGAQQATFLNDTFGRHGLAANDGSIYMVNAPTNEIFVYNIGTDSIVGSVPSPFPVGSGFAGAAFYVPSPGSAIGLGLLAGAGFKRRSR